MSLNVNLSVVVGETMVNFRLDRSLGDTIPEQLVAESVITIHASDPLIPQRVERRRHRVNRTDIPTLTADEVAGLLGALSKIATNAIDSISPDLRS